VVVNGKKLLMNDQDKKGEAMEIDGKLYFLGIPFSLCFSFNL